MSRRVFVMLFSITLVGAIWAVRPMMNSQTIPLVSAAQAQTPADHPSSFPGSLAEPSLEDSDTAQCIRCRLFHHQVGERQKQSRACHYIEYPQHFRGDAVDPAARRLLRHDRQPPSPLLARPHRDPPPWFSGDLRSRRGHARRNRANFVVEWAANRANYRTAYRGRYGRHPRCAGLLLHQSRKDDDQRDALMS